MNNIKNIIRLRKTELSAMKTYKQVIDTHQDNLNNDEQQALYPIYQGHEAAAFSLKTQIEAMGDTLTENASICSEEGHSLMDKTQKVCKKTAFKHLLKAEQNVTDNYEQVLENTDLPLYMRCLIEWKLMLIQQSHQRSLTKMLDSAFA